MRRQWEGGGSKIAKIEATSFMDGPLLKSYSYHIYSSLCLNFLPKIKNLKISLRMRSLVEVVQVLYLVVFLPLSGSFLVVSMNKFRKELTK